MERQMKTNKPEDYPLMWVWDTKRENAEKRRVTYIFPNGHCDALFEDGKDTNRWYHYAEIKEPEYMTREQAVCFMAQNPTYVLRRDACKWEIAGYGMSFEISRYEWTTTDGYKFGEPHNFTTDYLEVSDEAV